VIPVSMRHPIISMKEQKPQREVEGVVPRLLPATDPRPSCEGKATVELMTARLAELVNARMEPTGWICVYAHAVPVSEKKAAN
jgi:hypothetical protein